MTHNVWRFKSKRPKELTFEPGQATELAIDKDGWRENGRIFTFTSLPWEDHLEFIIKSYPEREAMTKEVANLNVGDQFILKNIYGSINYKGKGTFIAGGAGVTPFISILRELNHKDELDGHRLIYANNTEEDIINREEFERMLGDDFVNILAEEDVEPYDYGLITKDYLKEQIDSFNEYFYVCGPPAMMHVVEDALKELGVKDEQIIKETF